MFGLIVAAVVTFFGYSLFNSSKAKQNYGYSGPSEGKVDTVWGDPSLNPYNT